ncbi:MAG: orotidine-5'-phosphate decarboxylase [Candidatus Micrarchaeota archaeon]|nr:orotidine-5'-phosphate decarboxylase [Candidatus Micrarchaeota archaeon]
MNYYQKFEKFVNSYKNLLCFGLDPDLEKFPPNLDGSTKQKIVNFYSSIIDASPKLWALKPNYAFFAQYGFHGLMALRELIDRYKETHLIVLDAKRADIANTSKAYVQEIFEFFGADATTLWPFMGWDSIEPFATYSIQNSKGLYLLCRTTNPGAEDFLTKKMQDGQTLYQYIIQKVQSWAESYPQCFGLVAGATSLSDLENILNSISKRPVLLLIPGIGTQGGDPSKVIELLKKYNMQKMALINASSSISYAYLKTNQDYLESALQEIKKLQSILKVE